MIKKLWQEYTTATFGLDSNEDLPDFKDILKPSSEFWSREQSEPCTLSNIPWKVKVEIINAFLLTKRCEEEIQMLKSDMQETVLYWFQVVSNVSVKLEELHSLNDPFTRGTKCKLLQLKEHASLQYHQATRIFSAHIPLLVSPSIPSSISELCEDDSDTESESDISDIEL